MTQKPFIEYNTVPLPDMFRGWLLREFNGNHMIIGPHGRALALIPGVGEDATAEAVDRVEAIARLMSKAPELLRLLELFVEQTKAGQKPDLGEAMSLSNQLR
jgi:hypothetical protein